MQINVEKRLLTLDLDMILDSYVNRPGPHWWAGEHIGKFLHAATYAWRFTGDDRLMERMDYAVKSLIATQLPQWLPRNICWKISNSQRATAWPGTPPVWDVWAHKYNIIGLLSYYQATGDKKALQAAQRAADLMYENFVVKKKSMRLASSHVGMASTSVLEPIAVLYRLTGESRYLEFSHYIIESWEDEDDPTTETHEEGSHLLKSLLEHGNVYKTGNKKALRDAVEHRRACRTVSRRA